jgi:hypothetical protein
MGGIISNICILLNAENLSFGAAKKIAVNEPFYYFLLDHENSMRVNIMKKLG